jgi:hypothetical protein
MNIAKQIIFMALLFTSALAASAEAIDPEPSKYKDLFTLKTDKEFVGAQVEIYNSAGELITTNSLQKRKMVIDFGDAGYGTYTIRIVKGDELQEFTYIKK